MNKWRLIDISLVHQRIFLKSLGAAKNANTVYAQALDMIKEIIVTKFRTELDLAKAEKPPNPNNSHIRKFESAVQIFTRSYEKCS